MSCRGSSARGGLPTNGKIAESVKTAAANPPRNLLRQLRIATAEQHRKLDGALNLTSPGFDLWAYRRLLESFWGLHAAWEPRAVAQFSSVMAGFYDARRKLHLIEHDLLNLGHSAEEISALPLCEALARPTSFSETLGTAYVIEGSMLGGQLLSRHFAQTLELRPDRGCSYFAGYGDLTAAMWKDFGQAVASFAALTAIHEEIVSGARKTFTTVHHWLVERHE